MTKNQLLLIIIFLIIVIAFVLYIHVKQKLGSKINTKIINQLNYIVYILEKKSDRRKVQEKRE